MTDTGAALMALGDQRFVSLTTFRKTGERVSTPVWIAREGNALIVTTPAGSGKVKRLRRDPRVELQPCSRMGRVDDTDVPVAGTAELLTDNDVRQRLTKVIREKYRLEYLFVMGVERLVSRGSHERFIIRITPPELPEPPPPAAARPTERQRSCLIGTIVGGASRRGPGVLLGFLHS